MRASLVAARAVLASLIVVPGGLSAAEVKLPATDTTPAELVAAALRTELDGPSEQRKSLLEKALAIDPNFAPLDGTPATCVGTAIGAHSTKPPGRRLPIRSWPPTPNGATRWSIPPRATERWLRWCRKSRLPEESRIHWAKVLEFNPQDAEAIHGLGLQLHEGQLLTKEQIIEAKQQAGKRREAMRHWKPQFEHWLHAIESDNDEKRDAAIAALRELHDPEAIEALETVFCGKTSPDHADELARLFIETVSKIPTAEATQVLVRHAMGGRQRDLACSELKKRPLYAYVPQILASMPVPSNWSVSYRVSLLPTGGVVVDADFDRQDGTIEQTVSQQLVIDNKTQIVSRNHPEWNGIHEDVRKNAKLVSSTVRSLQSKEQQARDHNSFVKAQQKHVSSVLAQITGVHELNDRDEWQKWWDGYTETYTPSYDPRQRSGKFAASYFGAILEYRIRQMSCFPLGTPVLTALGKRPIETLRPGDRIVCENVETGELTTKPIQATTLRPAAPLVKITLGAHTLSATRGHPFWINGQGWTMAKHLKVGQILHGVDGALPIDALEEGPPREAYNLVVGDYGTYFVGELPVLVHDNSPLTETTTIVPGLDVAATP